MSNKIIGKVIWFDKRDGNGVIKSTLGTKFKREVKFYTDTSAINEPIKAGDVVSFEHNSEIRDCLCAKNVSIKK